MLYNLSYNTHRQQQQIKPQIHINARNSVMHNEVDWIVEA